MYLDFVPLLVYWSTAVFLPLLHVMNTLDVDGIETFVNSSMRAVASTLPQVTVTYYVYPAADDSGGDWGNYELAPPEVDHCVYVPLATHWPTYAVCDLLKIAGIEAELRTAAMNSTVSPTLPPPADDTPRASSASTKETQPATHTTSHIPGTVPARDLWRGNGFDFLSLPHKVMPRISDVFVLLACAFTCFVMAREVVRSFGRWSGLSVDNRVNKSENGTLSEKETTLSRKDAPRTPKSRGGNYGAFAAGWIVPRVEHKSLEVLGSLAIQRRPGQLGKDVVARRIPARQIDEPQHPSTSSGGSVLTDSSSNELAEIFAATHANLEDVEARMNVIYARQQSRKMKRKITRERRLRKQGPASTDSTVPPGSLTELDALKAELQQLRAQRAEDLRVFNQRLHEVEDHLRCLFAIFQVGLNVLNTTNSQSPTALSTRFNATRRQYRQPPLETPSLVSSCSRFTRSLSSTPPPATPPPQAFARVNIFEEPDFL